MRDLTDLASKAASQHGLLTTLQIQEQGTTPAQLNQLLSTGALVRVRRGVVRVAGAPQTWYMRLLAACLCVRGYAAGSHRAALRMWEMRTVDREIEITVRYPARASAEGAIVHRSKDLVRGDITRIEGMPVTTPVRSLCDAGAVLPPTEVGRLVDHAVATGLVTVQDLIRFRTRVGRQGRNGVGALQLAIDDLPADAALLESGPEIDLLRIIEAAGLPAPVPQLPVVAGGRHARIDLAYPDRQIAIEYDGYDVHNRPDRFTDDRRRQNDLVIAGWTVIRFTSRDLRNPGLVAERIARALEAAPPGLVL